MKRLSLDIQFQPRHTCSKDDVQLKIVVIKVFLTIYKSSTLQELQYRGLHTLLGFTHLVDVQRPTRSLHTVYLALMERFVLIQLRKYFKRFSTAVNMCHYKSLKRNAHKIFKSSKKFAGRRHGVCVVGNDGPKTLLFQGNAVWLAPIYTDIIISYGSSSTHDYCVNYRIWSNDQGRPQQWRNTTHMLFDALEQVEWFTFIFDGHRSIFQIFSTWQPVLRFQNHIWRIGAVDNLGWVECNAKVLQALTRSRLHLE